MRRTFWLAGTLILTASAISACGGGAHHSADPTTTAPSTTTTSTASTLPAATTTTAPDPVNIPATIDVAYVDAVLAQLNHVYGNAQRIEIATKFLPKSIPPLLRAIYADPQYARELYVFSQALQGDTLDQARLPAGDRVTTVSQLHSSSSSCIEIQVLADYSAVAKAPPPPDTLWIVLRPKAVIEDPSGVNTTPWAISYEMSAEPTGSDACA